MGSSSRRIWRAGVALAIVASLAGASRPARAEFAFEVVKSFELPDLLPSDLVLRSDGALYGITQPSGTIFRIDAAGAFTALHSFASAERRLQALVVAPDGTLYGSTFSTIFRFDKGGTVLPLFFTRFPSEERVRTGRNADRAMLLQQGRAAA